jgi:NitT/TauT family transport system substrate-binding protein
MCHLKPSFSYLFYRVQLGLCLLVLIAACSPTNETPLRIGTNSWIGYEPLYLARSLSFYDNTTIKLVELTSASDVIHAIRSGTLEGAALTLDETLSLIDDGFDLKVILVFDFSNGGDVLLAKPDIKTLKELRGKRVAVESSAVGALLLDSALSSVDLAVTDIEIVSCTADEHIACYQTNDAVVTFDPVKSQLLGQGASLLYDSRQIPDKIVDVLVVSEKITQSHPNSLRQLLNGYFKARQYLSEKPLKAAELMSSRLKLTPEEVIAGYSGLRMPLLSENHQLLTGDKASLNQTANELAQFMFNRKLLKTSVELRHLGEPAFLPKTQP